MTRNPKGRFDHGDRSGLITMQLAALRLGIPGRSIVRFLQDQGIEFQKSGQKHKPVFMVFEEDIRRLGEKLKSLPARGQCQQRRSTALANEK